MMLLTNLTEGLLLNTEDDVEYQESPECVRLVVDRTGLENLFYIHMYVHNYYSL